MKDIVEIAAKLATQAHAGQMRPGGTTPYIVHPMRVAARLQQQGASPLVLATAWLHDVIEDTIVAPSELATAGIPREVVYAVATLTKLKDETQAEYLRRVKHDPIAKRVKREDMLDNLSDNPTPKQVAKYATGLLILMDVYPQFEPAIMGEAQEEPTCPGLWAKGTSQAYRVCEAHGRLEITFRQGNTWRVDGLPSGMLGGWVRVGNLQPGTETLQ